MKHTEHTRLAALALAVAAFTTTLFAAPPPGKGGRGGNGGGGIMKRFFACLAGAEFWLLALLIAIGAPGKAAGQSALSFDGVNDYVTFGAAPGLGASAVTIETWFKRAGAGVAANTGTGGVSAIPLVTKGRGEAENSNVDMNYFLGIRASDGVLCADFEEGAGGASPGLNHPIAGVTPIANGVWYHAAATYDGATWRLYLNGNLEATLSVGRPLRADSIQHAALGSALNSTGVASGFFHGSLDEARIWNHARSAAEIAANRDAEITSAPGLLGRWGLNEGSGTTAGDSSGSAIHGTLTNGPMWVAGFQQSVAPVITRGPYLQLGTPTSVIVRWRTDLATDSRVSFGTTAGQLTTNADHATVTTEHEVTLGGLAPDTQYFYAIGSTTTTLATGADFTFFTAPPVGATQPVRIWALGDSGTAAANAAAIRNGYTAFNGNGYTDLLLMLGDNAYNNGTDAEYQAAVFNMYPTFLRQTPLWPTIGNHDTASSTNPPATLPYFQMFTLPTAGEAGGAASGTEKYYSFDFANIHFICLDSMSSSRQPGSAMLTWLENDLTSTTQQWIVAFWHHPPYTKGSHNSDTEAELIEMRANVLPLLEAGGVDLVMGGHSHTYERSYFINGHYGVSTTFSPAQHLMDGGDGRETGTGAYAKPDGNAANQGTVYLVAGSSGKLSNWTGGSTADTNPTPHPVMFTSLRRLGSMVLDVDGNRMDVKFLRETGAVDDSFTIIKNVPNTLPSVSVASPANGATFTAPANITVAANATDSDGSVAQVDFYAGSTVIGTDTSAPFVITWSNVAAGNYALTATATDNLGGTTTSAPVSITVNSSGTTVSFQDGVNGYSGTRDTSIQASSANTNYGTNAALLIDGSPDIATLIKWDLRAIPAGRQVVAVTLTFNVTDVTAHTYELYTLNRAWSETSATWRRASTGVNWQVAGANGANDRGSAVLGTFTSSTTGVKTITLNAAGVAQVQAWVNNPVINHGFVILDYAVTDGIDASSSEASTIANRPMITITYQ